MDIAFNSECSYPENVLSSKPCSGNGDCINSICVCSTGYTGRSDWINLDGYDCHINLMAEKVLWAVPCILSLMNLFRCISYFRYEWKRFSGDIEKLRKRPLPALMVYLIILQVSLMEPHKK